MAVAYTVWRSNVVHSPDPPFLYTTKCVYCFLSNNSYVLGPANEVGFIKACLHSVRAGWICSFFFSFFWRGSHWGRKAINLQPLASKLIYVQESACRLFKGIFILPFLKCILAWN